MSDFEYGTIQAITIQDGADLAVYTLELPPPDARDKDTFHVSKDCVVELMSDNSYTRAYRVDYIGTEDVAGQCAHVTWFKIRKDGEVIKMINPLYVIDVSYTYFRELDKS